MLVRDEHEAKRAAAPHAARLSELIVLWSRRLPWFVAQNSRRKVGVLHDVCRWKPASNPRVS